MQSIKNLCSKLLNCIHKCFQTDREQLRERMIELEVRIDQLPPRKESDSKIGFLRFSEKEQHLTTDTVERKPEKEELPFSQELNRASERSEDSFFSINSAARSSQSISRRTFSRIRGQKSSLNNIDANSSKENEFKEITNDNLSEEMNVELGRINSEFDCYADLMFEWNEKEYDEPASNLFWPKMSQIEMRKIEQNNTLDETFNKLEDFKTFYFNDLNDKFEKSGKKTDKSMSFTHGHIFNKSPLLKSVYQSENENFNIEGDLMMMLIIFQCNSSNCQEILKWYNSQSILSKLFNFQKIRLVENGSCPILEVDQFGSDLREKQTFQIFRQIESVKFDNEPDVEYTIQLDCSFKKGTSFRSLLRFQNSDNGIVEIYAESNERLSSSPQDYFYNKWQNFEKSVKEKLSRTHNTNPYR